ncbi:DUF5694 domain-containing protein [Hymenobacter aerilatus]|uniref:DUF5694 domain-containing protein n=1 Tax=Hymenobacter aerilatus TaxID=2932251 RepID=A0A8T9SXE3_9BACT|nr:DUF5694 domain-containing protein [Hymenobacter aerilatus]UOR06902.1 DUF5694 domain-containing protein [Hymenobacter aerilatus]
MSRAQGAPSNKVQVMVVGSDHLAQLYNKQPQSDVFSAKKQAELAQVRAQLARFRPTVILVEAEPREQAQLDSLYRLYQQGQLALESLPTGRSERYQVGFALAKQLQLPSPKGVDYYATTSQSLLSTGTNIEAYTRELKQLQTTARPLKRLVQHDSLSLYDYLALVNRPELISLVHRLQFNTPAQVMNGTFAAGGTNTVDLGKVDTEYIGAHFITLFYNRNLKIYSNILRAQQQSQAPRVLVLFGVAHVGVLQELLAANPAYEVVPATRYLKISKQKLRHLQKQAGH